MARDDEKIAELMAVLAEDVGEAKSLFLPIVPLRKFPPPDPFQLPSHLLIQIITDIAIQAIFPFKFGGTSPTLHSEDAVHKYIGEMRNDRDLVIKSPLKLAIDKPKKLDIDLKVEYFFSIKLLDRIHTTYDLALGDKPYFYHVLLDLIALVVHYQDKFLLTKDDTGNYWFRIRDEPPFRDGAFFTEATILVQTYGQFVRCVFGEITSDIDNWYTHEYFSAHLTSFLAESASSGPIHTHQQTGVFRSFLQKFSKVFTKNPG